MSKILVYCKKCQMETAEVSLNEKGLCHHCIERIKHDILFYKQKSIYEEYYLEQLKRSIKFCLSTIADAKKTLVQRKQECKEYGIKVK